MGVGVLVNPLKMENMCRNGNINVTVILYVGQSYGIIAADWIVPWGWVLGSW